MQKSSLKQNHHFYSNSTLRVLQLTEFHLPPKYVYAALQFFFLCGKENMTSKILCISTRYQNENQNEALHIHRIICQTNCVLH